MSDSAPPAAGWYADPENPAGERWWNGSSWSDHRRASTGFTYGAAAASAEPARPDPYAPAPGTPPASPYAPSVYAPAPYGAPAYGAGTNGLAVAGLIVASAGWLVFGVLASIAGIILSGFGLAQARKREAAGHPNPGRGIAMAGLIVGIVVTALGVIAIVFYVAVMFSVVDSSTY